MIKRHDISFTSQGDPRGLYYTASLFSRDERRIMDVIFSESLIDLKRGIRQTWGRLNPGRTLLIGRNTVNMSKPHPGWLKYRKLTFSKPFFLCPNSKRVRKLWPNT